MILDHTVHAAELVVVELDTEKDDVIILCKYSTPIDCIHIHIAMYP